MTKNIIPAICIITILLMVSFAHADGGSRKPTAEHKQSDSIRDTNPSQSPCCDSELQSQDFKASLNSPKQAATEPGLGAEANETQAEKTAQMTITKEAPSKPSVSSSVKSGQTANISNATSNPAISRNKRIMELIRQLNELRDAAVASSSRSKSPITQNTVKDNTNDREGWKTPAANSSAVKDLGQGQTTQNPAMNFDPRTKNRTDNMVRPDPRSLRNGTWSQSSGAGRVHKRRSPFQPPDHVIEKIKAKQVKSPITKDLSNRAAPPVSKKCGECPPPPENRKPVNPATSQIKAPGKPSVANQGPVSPREKFNQAAAKARKQMNASNKAMQNNKATGLAPDNKPITSRSGVGAPEAPSAPVQSAGPASNQAANKWQTPASAAKRQISGRVVGRDQ